ncbi:MAG: SDR family NAD(P)-dependent oxidoreductase [Maricaulaceae bacterium]|jgi:NAD(P)-dependent dehydrogenase (short-subunit alcohol dehydrogenase family)
MTDIRFDGRVAIVTGAGAGLGRAHALGLAARGAKVVVNDLGGARDGTGGSSAAAQAVVEEIKAAGGEAIADGADVSNEAQVEAMMGRALDAWGQIDILINNAGILRDKTFHKMSLDDFRAVLEVHLWGSVVCTHKVWNHMRDRAYGRIVFTTSSTGLYGNFGQANYGAAKLGVVGLMNTLHLEGAKYNIRVNSISPVAATRMTEDLMPQEALDLLAPEAVTPAVLYLVSEDAPSRAIIAAGAGGFARALIYETDGVYIPAGELSPEAVAAKFDQISDPAGQEAYDNGSRPSLNFMGKAAEALGLEMPGRR